MRVTPTGCREFAGVRLIIVTMNTRLVQILGISLLLGLPPVLSTAKQASCEGAPDFAVLDLPEPVSQWAVIECTNSGHSIAAPEGYTWLAPNGQPFTFSAFAFADVKNLQNPHQFIFTEASHRELRSLFADTARDMLTKAGGQASSQLQPWQLDVRASSMTLYNLFFFEQDGSNPYVLGCVNRCAKSVLLQVKQLE